MLNKEEYDHLREKLEKFVVDRGWLQYHHPKNRIMGLSVEVSELMEHFVGISEKDSIQIVSDPEKLREISYEAADVFHSLLHLFGIFNLDPPFVKELENSPPKVLVEKLVVQTGALMEDFLWRPETELEKMSPSKEVISKLEETHKTILQLFSSLKINPISIALEKLTVLEKKYPVEIVKGGVAKYFQRKKELK